MTNLNAEDSKSIANICEIEYSRAMNIAEEIREKWSSPKDPLDRRRY